MSQPEGGGGIKVGEIGEGEGGGEGSTGAAGAVRLDAWQLYRDIWAEIENASQNTILSDDIKQKIQQYSQQVTEAVIKSPLADGTKLVSPSAKAIYASNTKKLLDKVNAITSAGAEKKLLEDTMIAIETGKPVAKASVTPQQPGPIVTATNNALQNQPNQNQPLVSSDNKVAPTPGKVGAESTESTKTEYKGPEAVRCFVDANGNPIPTVGAVLAEMGKLAIMDVLRHLFVVRPGSVIAALVGGVSKTIAAFAGKIGSVILGGLAMLANLMGATTPARYLGFWANEANKLSDKAFKEMDEQNSDRTVLGLWHLTKLSVFLTPVVATLGLALFSKTLRDSIKTEIFNLAKDSGNNVVYNLANLFLPMAVRKGIGLAFYGAGTLFMTPFAVISGAIVGVVKAVSGYDMKWLREKVAEPTGQAFSYCAVGALARAQFIILNPISSLMPSGLGAGAVNYEKAYYSAFNTEKHSLAYHTLMQYEEDACWGFKFNPSKHVIVNAFDKGTIGSFRLFRLGIGLPFMALGGLIWGAGSMLKAPMRLAGMDTSKLDALTTAAWDFNKSVGSLVVKGVANSAKDGDLNFGCKSSITPPATPVTNNASNTTAAPVIDNAAPAGTGTLSMAAQPQEPNLSVAPDLGLGTSTITQPQTVQPQTVQAGTGNNQGPAITAGVNLAPKPAAIGMSLQVGPAMRDRITSIESSTQNLDPGMMQPRIASEPGRASFANNIIDITTPRVSFGFAPQQYDLPAVKRPRRDSSSSIDV